MNPIQPYFALSANKYYKKELAKHGIAHLYEYTCELSDDHSMLAIPDGCIDILFDETDPSISPYAAGSVLTGQKIHNLKGHKYFGIRFVPGVVPDILDGRFSDFLDNQFDLEDCVLDKTLLERIGDAKSFIDKVNSFFTVYNVKKKPGWKGNKYDIYTYVRKRILETQGIIRINDLERETGYTSRYIDKLFKEYSGLSPKVYSQIIRFQCTINHLNHDDTLSFSDISAEHGYYDQAQFTRDFKKFALYTPGAYRSIVQSSNYTEKFVLQ